MDCRLVETLCRTCLQVISEDAWSATSKHDIFLTPDIVKKLVLCTSLTVEPEDGYPKHLCDCCFAKVNEFHEFQTMCVESAERFKFKELLKLPFENKNNEYHFKATAESKMEIIIEEIDVDVLFDEDDSNIKLSTLKKQVQDCPLADAKTNHRKRGRPGRSKVLGSTKSKKVKPTIDGASSDAEARNDKSNDFWELELCEKEYNALTEERLETKDENSKKSIANTENANLKVSSLHTTATASTTITHACTQSGCARAYKNKSTLNMHLRIFHKLGPDLNLHICEVCGKVFKHSKILNVHRYTHKDPSELPFPCELAPNCSRRFARKDRLKTHMLRHAGVKNFVCPHCGMRKTTQNELKIHINYHTLERTWPCRFCEHICNSAGNLKTHVRTMHERAKDYACSYCERRFAKPDTRKYHEMTHTGEKPNQCKDCGKRFTQPAALHTHQKTQHGRHRLDVTKAKTKTLETAAVCGVNPATAL